MADKELRAWVSSRLHDLLGFSESTVAQFVLSVAKKHTSSDSLASVLKQQGLPAGQETAAFAAELLSRLPSTSGRPAGPSAAQVEARQAKQFLKKSAAYELLEGPPEPAPPSAAPLPPPSVVAPAVREHRKERKLRDKAKSSRWLEEDEDGDAGRVKHHKKQKVCSACCSSCLLAVRAYESVQDSRLCSVDCMHMGDMKHLGQPDVHIVLSWTRFSPV